MSQDDNKRIRVYDFLNADDMWGYTDYNQKIEDVMDEFNLDKETAEGYVWNWTLRLCWCSSEEGER